LAVAQASNDQLEKILSSYIDIDKKGGLTGGERLRTGAYSSSWWWW
jgi:hypothetical protein